MYNLDQTVNEEQGGGNYFGIGIHENVTLKDITLEEASNGNPYLKFHFEGENGQEVAHTEWPISQDDANFEKKVKNFLIRIKHICTKFVPAEAVNINAPDFQGFANQVIALMKPNLTKTKVRIKLVYNYRNYVSIPKYVPFMEAMSIPADKSKLKMDPNFDKMEKEEGTDPQLSTATSPSPGTGVSGGDSGMPF